MRRPRLKDLSPLLAVILFTMALWILSRELQKYHYQDIVAGIDAISGRGLALAFFCVAADYIALTWFDALAMRYIRRDLSYGKVALTSFISYTFTHNIGLSVLSGGSVRYYMYTAWGLSAIEVAAVIAFCVSSFIIGIIAAAGLIVLFEPFIVPEFLYPSFISLRPLGLILMSLTAAYFFLCYARRVPVSFRGWEFRLPSPALAAGQVIVSFLDWVFVSGVLYYLLPEGTGPSWPVFTGFFILANFAGILSHIPGGLGVFETVMVFLLSPTVPKASTLSALIVFRGIYYILPFIVSLVLFGSYEALRRREAVRRAIVSITDLSELVPSFLSLSVFASGVVLLASGVLPPGAPDIRLPPYMMEAANILGSVSGMGLVILSLPVQRRLQRAYKMSLYLLAAGTAFTFLKGPGYGEPLILLSVLAILLPAKNFFYRKAPVASEAFLAAWAVAIGLATIGTTWLGFLSTGFPPPLISPALHAQGAAIMTLLLFVLFKSLTRRPIKHRLPDINEIALARDIVMRAGDARGRLALTGDKELLFSERKNAFVMFAIEGRSWVAMGGSVGPKEERTELFWRFYEAADSSGGAPVFFDLTAEEVKVAGDLGLTHFKLGDEVRIPLVDLRLTGRTDSLIRRMDREGFSCRICSHEEARALMPSLREISEEWLSSSMEGEKVFTTGAFSPEYLKGLPVSIVSLKGEPVAFAALWHGRAKEGLTVDFFRYRPELTREVMVYILGKTALEGKKAGFNSLRLGLEPPEGGFRNEEIAPLMAKLGRRLFSHGEHFLNPQELRGLISDFSLLREQRFLAYPAGLMLPRILMDIGRLTMRPEKI